MFWKRCVAREKNDCATQSMPSLPIGTWANELRRSIQPDMPWQPMPPLASEPAGTSVDRLCGQPAQK